MHKRGVQEVVFVGLTFKLGPEGLVEEATSSSVVSGCLRLLAFGDARDVSTSETRGELADVSSARGAFGILVNGF